MDEAEFEFLRTALVLCDDDLDRTLVELFSLARKVTSPDYPPAKYTLAQLIVFSADEEQPYTLRKKLFKDLQAMARDAFWETPAGTVPSQRDIFLNTWALGVASGQVQAPTQPRGRPRKDEALQLRNRLIGLAVRWLRQDHGHTREAAIKRVTGALEIHHEHVKAILKKNH